MKSERINYGDLKIAEEILPFVKTRLKIIQHPSLRNCHTGYGRVLVVNTCIIGDFLSYLPALRTLAKENDLTFDMIVSPTVKPLAEHVIGVNQVFVAKSSYDRCTEQNETPSQDIPGEYDTLIIFRLSREAYQLISHVKCGRVISSDVVLLKYVMHLAARSLLHKEMKQSREVMFETLRIKSADKREELYDLFRFSPSDYAFLDHLPELQSSDRKIMIHTGSGWKVKLWRPDKWCELIARLHELGPYRMLFIGATREEEAQFQQIQTSHPESVLSLIGKVNLSELFLVMQRCDYFIGVDSGPRNLAHFANLRSISLLSPAAVKNFLPFNDEDRVIEKSNRLPANLFNFGSNDKMDTIEVEAVVEAFKQLSSAGSLLGCKSLP